MCMYWVSVVGKSDPMCMYWVSVVGKSDPMCMYLGVCCRKE